MELPEGPDLIEFAMARLNITLEQLAARIGMKKRTVEGARRGEFDMSARMKLAIHEALKHAPDLKSEAFQVSGTGKVQKLQEPVTLYGLRGETRDTYELLQSILEDFATANSARKRRLIAQNICDVSAELRDSIKDDE